MWASARYASRRATASDHAGQPASCNCEVAWPGRQPEPAELGEQQPGQGAEDRPVDPHQCRAPIGSAENRGPHDAARGSRRPWPRHRGEQHKSAQHASDHEVGGVDAVRLSSKTSLSTCRRIRYSSRSDTGANMPDRRMPLITAGQQRWPNSGTPQGRPPGNPSRPRSLGRSWNMINQICKSTSGRKATASLHAARAADGDREVGERRRRHDQAVSRGSRHAQHARTLTAAVAKDGEWYVARCLEVEVASQGETIDEALRTCAGLSNCTCCLRSGSALPRLRVARRPLERVVGHLLPARLDTGEV